MITPTPAGISICVVSVIVAEQLMSTVPPPSGSRPVKAALRADSVHVLTVVNGLEPRACATSHTTNASASAAAPASTIAACLSPHSPDVFVMRRACYPTPDPRRPA
jgi:hypothetical protein